MAEGAVQTARRLNDIGTEDRAAIRNLGRQAGSALRVHQVLLSRPIANPGDDMTTRRDVLRGPNRRMS